MFGSMLGNVVGISYFLAFQALGILLALILLKKETLGFTVLIGSVFGSFALQWLPVLYAFLFDFTVKAHIFALAAMAVIVVVVYVLSPERSLLNGRKICFDLKAIFLENPVLFLLLPLFLFTAVTLLHHTISFSGGAMHSGQSTYGDMNMHLGFITSIANQKTFPPEYSILPGTKLAYPFLSDSISSSVYLWGTSLRTAYLLPMFFALLQVFFGMYMIAKTLLRTMGGSYRGKALLAFVLFFFNGGFGFVYFIGKGSENFTRIFTAFYETPTNYVTENIQWHNIICDMLIPQRATLFGWAILFPVLALLLKARQEKNHAFFIIAGILSGGLVLIHTHSFLALGMLCAVFLVQDLYSNGQTDETKRWPLWARFTAVMVFLIGMSLISMKQLSDTPWEPNVILSMGFFILGLFAGILIYYLTKNFSRDILLTWGLFLGIVLILAIPQLFGFTFQQAQGEQFVRGTFNWVNTADSYLLFNLKNLGILFILAMLMFVFGSRRQIQIALPGVLIWLVSEFIVFQPNTYDNNKLLLVAYLFFCVAIADFVWETIPDMMPKSIRQARILVTSAVTFLAVFGAVLTMGREYVSDYELYDSSYIALCEWVEENTEPDDIFLTANNHNNAVASLTGRNIVCGSGTFLYFHGVDYAQNETDVKTMYEDPSQRDSLLAKYNVSYLVIGAWELGTYSIPDYENILSTYEVVYNKDGVVVLAV